MVMLRHISINVVGEPGLYGENSVLRSIMENCECSLHKLSREGFELTPTNQSSRARELGTTHL